MQKEQAKIRQREKNGKLPDVFDLGDWIMVPYNWGQRIKTMGTTNLQPAGRRRQKQQVKQNEKTEKYAADEEQGENQPDQTQEEEIGSLPEKEFRVIIVKMIQNLRNRMKKIEKMFNKDLEELKSKQTVMNNTINETKNSLEGINSRITETEEQISGLEDKMVEITTAEQNKEKRMKRIEDSLRDLWETIKRTSIRIIEVPEKAEKKKETEKIFEDIIVENFPNMGKERVNQLQEMQIFPYRINPRRNMPRHILIKLSKIKYKEKI